MFVRILKMQNARVLTVVEDGLTQEWTGNDGWNSPAAERLAEWVKKAFEAFR